VHQVDYLTEIKTLCTSKLYLVGYIKYTSSDGGYMKVKVLSMWPI
jgi:hypothetical protein